MALSGSITLSIIFILLSSKTLELAYYNCDITLFNRSSTESLFVSPVELYLKASPIDSADNVSSCSSIATHKNIIAQCM